MEEITSGLGGQLWPAGLLEGGGCDCKVASLTPQTIWGPLGRRKGGGASREDEEHFSPCNTAAGVAICEVLWYWAAPTQPSCVGNTEHDVCQSGRFNGLHK